MRVTDIAFVASVQHTGTWFTINFLRNFFPDVRELTFILEQNMEKEAMDVNYRYRYDKPLVGPTVTHIHLPIVRRMSLDTEYPFTRFERDWMSNLTKKRSASIGTILTLCNFLKTVIPVRDPVAAILSREVRHPQFRHFFIVDGFVALATEFSKHPNVKFLPIDMTDDEKVRESLLLSVLQHCGVPDAVPADAYEPIVRRYAQDWFPDNVTPGNELKIMYENGDIVGLKARLGPKWAEIEYLRNMASIILPWMASIGYTRERLIKL